MRTVAHVTHEAVEKMGGIGAVLQGLITSRPYRSRNLRTVLVGPFIATEGGVANRLGSNGEVLYSSADGITQHPLAGALDHVRREFHVNIVYGHRRFTDPQTGVTVSPELVLIDVTRMNLACTNDFKRRLWETYGIDSRRYESAWDYDLYVKLAEPALAILKAIGAAGRGDECVIVAHEFMGLPTALAARLDKGAAFRTIFHAHEVAAVRRLVEDHPGHDVRFYNALSLAMPAERYLDDVFGPQDHFYRHALVKTSRYCDCIFAVGDYVVKELRFIGPEFANANIETTYNGIPAEQISLQQKRESQQRMRDYAETLLGDRPDYIFTHVSRTAPSKAFWRDLRVLEHVEREFRRTGRSGVMFLLSTELPARDPDDIRDMERWWHWPVAHREIGSDLSGGEALVYQSIQEFNARSRQVKIVYVNQFGWAPAVCGARMPRDMTFADIRRGTDVEFGQSIYEPFGISQLEPLTYGAICVPSSVCGCVGLVELVAEGAAMPNIIVADYCKLDHREHSEAELLAIGQEQRDEIEARTAERVAWSLLQQLPANDADAERLLTTGYELASQMSWDVIAADRILPAMDAICLKPAHLRVA